MVILFLAMVVAPPPPLCDARCRKQAGAERREHPERHGFSVIGVEPKGNADDWINGDDDLENKHGEIVVEFHVSTEGRMTVRSVIKTSGDADLDSLTCKLLARRARFYPPQDGKIATGAYKHAW